MKCFTANLFNCEMKKAYLFLNFQNFSETETEIAREPNSINASSERLMLNIFVCFQFSEEQEKEYEEAKKKKMLDALEEKWKVKQ